MCKVDWQRVSASACLSCFMSNSARVMFKNHRTNGSESKSDVMGGSKTPTVFFTRPGNTFLHHFACFVQMGLVHAHLWWHHEQIKQQTNEKKKKIKNLKTRGFAHNISTFNALKSLFNYTRYCKSYCGNTWKLKDFPSLLVPLFPFPNFLFNFASLQKGSSFKSQSWHLWRRCYCRHLCTL